MSNKTKNVVRFICKVVSYLATAVLGLLGGSSL